MIYEPWSNMTEVLLPFSTNLISNVNLFDYIGNICIDERSMYLCISYIRDSLTEKIRPIGMENMYTIHTEKYWYPLMEFMSVKVLVVDKLWGISMVFSFGRA